MNLVQMRLLRPSMTTTETDLSRRRKRRRRRRRRRRGRGPPVTGCFLSLWISFFFNSFVDITAVRWGEYCDTEVFRAECPEGDVILLESALYGRMRLGRCVEVDVAGYVGCSRDVLRLADRRCSARRVCEIRIPDAEFESTGPCLKELKTYLEVAYSCVAVETVTLDSCKSQTEFDVTRPRGYLASDFASSMTPLCDASKQPWVIRGQQGQQVRLTLYDFAFYEDDRGSYGNRSASKDSTAVCRVLGRVYDAASVHRSTPLCRLNDRRVDDKAFESNGSFVKITISNSKDDDDDDRRRFLIGYEIVGCSDPKEVAENSQFVRLDRSRAHIRCLHSDVTWSLNCSDDDRWTEALGNCSSATEGDPKDFEDSPSEETFAMEFQVIVVVAVFAALFLLLSLFLFCIFRRQRRMRSRDQTSHESDKREEGEGDSLSWAHRHPHNNPTTTTSSSSSSSSSSAAAATTKSSLRRNSVQVNGSRYVHIWRTLNEDERQRKTGGGKEQERRAESPSS